MSTICDFEEEIGKALITTNVLLLYRTGETCGLLESIYQPSGWFFPPGGYTRQLRVYFQITSIIVFTPLQKRRTLKISKETKRKIKANGMRNSMGAATPESVSVVL